MSSQSDITQQFIQGGVIPADLIGQSSVSKAYVDGELEQRDEDIAAAASAASTAQGTIDTHIASAAAHSAVAITYSGPVVASNVKQAIDVTDQRVSTIVSGAGSSNAEIIDARQPATGLPFTVLRDRLNNSDTQISTANTAINTKATKPTSSVAFVGWLRDTTTGITDEWGYFDWNAGAGGVLDQTITLPLALTSILSIQVSIDDSASGNWGNTRVLTATSVSGNSIRILAYSTAAEAGIRLRWLVKGV